MSAEELAVAAASSLQNPMGFIFSGDQLLQKGQKYQADLTSWRDNDGATRKKAASMTESRQNAAAVEVAKSMIDTRKGAHAAAEANTRHLHE